MFGADSAGAGIDLVAHIIQEALTPVFLLSGIATLLNVFSTRLSRVADQVTAVTNALATCDAADGEALARDLRNLYSRSIALDAAVIIGAVGGAATCGAVLTLFLGSLRDATSAWLLFALFGLAVVCALGSIAAYTAEMLMAGIGIRREVVKTRSAAESEAGEMPEPHPTGAGPTDSADSPGGSG